jgi:hypothetical protein
MTKKLMVVCALALAVAMLGLAGCDDYVTPAGVVRTAAQKLKENKVGGFRAALKGEALARFGTRDGMSELAKRLGAYASLSVGKAHQTSLTPVTNNGFQTAVAFYDVDVYGKESAAAPKESRLMTAFVQCDIYGLEQTPTSPIPGQPSECRVFPEQCPAYPRNVTEVSQCWVIDLR